MIIPLLLYGSEKTFPPVTAEPARVFLFGEPNERCLADDMVFRNETEQPRIGEIDGIVGTYPVVVLGKTAILHGLTFYV